MSSMATTKTMRRLSNSSCFRNPLPLRMMPMLVTIPLLLLLMLLMLNDCDAETEVTVQPPRHLSVANAKTHQFSAEQKMALQQVIRTMMGFGRDMSPAGGLRQPPDGGHQSSAGHQVAPRYMHRLYEKYRVAAEAVGMPHEMADTVRNINADLAIVNNGSLFVFNLTSLLEAETILRAEVHIYKRRLKVSNPLADPSSAETTQPYSEPGFIVVKVYELGPRILRERASFRLPDAGHSGWHTFDVTSAIKVCSLTQRTGATPRMLALSFSFDEDDDAAGRSRSSTGKLLLLSKFVRKLSRPFLMVFSQENHNNSLDAQLDSLFRRGDDRPSERSAIEEDSWRWDYDNPLLSHGRLPVQGRKNRPAFRSRIVWSSPSEVRGPRRLNLSDEIFVMESSSGTRDTSSDSGWNATGRVVQKYAVEEEAIGGMVRGRFYHAGFAPNADNVSAKSHSIQRQKRQVVADNEIPQEVTFSDPEPVSPVFYNLPKTNPGILRGRSRTGRKDVSSTPRPEVEFGVEEKVEVEEQEEEASKRRGKGRAGEGSSVSVLLPRSERGREAGGSGQKRNGAREVCGKRKLVVDFADIGWSEWIISPKSFEAHYCDGLCAYPMAPRLRATNHATIQSIVKAIGLQTEVPSPCCIPASLSSVTLLYFDQNQNVVLKNYPDMTVRSCACR